MNPIWPFCLNINALGRSRCISSLVSSSDEREIVGGSLDPPILSLPNASLLAGSNVLAGGKMVLDGTTGGTHLPGPADTWLNPMVSPRITEAVLGAHLVP